MFTGEGVYWIRNKSLLTKFIDAPSPNRINVRGGERASRPIGLFSPSLTRTQLWLVEQVSDGESFVIRNFDIGLFLGVQNKSDADGTPIILFPYDGDEDDEELPDSRHWKITWVSHDNKCVNNTSLFMNFTINDC